MLIAHLSDVHIAESGSVQGPGFDTAAIFEAAVSELNAFEPRPDIVLMTGDFTGSGTVAEYEVFKQILEKLEIPFHLIPGNHDNHTAMRAVLGELDALGDDGTFIQHVVDDYPVRLIGLDSTMVGHHSGELCEKRIAWLDGCLEEARDRPTALFMHHPPVTTGIWWLDCIGLSQGTEALEELIGRHRQVKAVFCGHFHRAIQSTLSGVPVFIAPSIGIASVLDLRHEGPPRSISEPPAMQFHSWTGASFVTHTHYVGRNDTVLDWIPLMPNWPVRLELMRNHAPIPKDLGI